MSMTDPIADMLTRIRNGSTARHSTVEIPASKMKAEIARLMTEQGYITGYDKKQGEHGQVIIVDKDYRIPAEERYEPGRPEFADSEGNLVEDPQNLVKEKLLRPYKTGTMNEVLQWEK